MGLETHGHFLNVVPRQICDMLPPNASTEDRKRLAYCAILHHVSVSSSNSVYLEAYKPILQIPFQQYTRHTAPGEGIAETDKNDVGISAYWNETSALICLANLSDSPPQKNAAGQLPSSAESLVKKSSSHWN